MARLELTDLESDGTVKVHLSGTEQPAFPGGTPCLYAEAVYGERHGEDWTYWSQIGSTKDAIVVHTPKGDLTISPHLLRLHLSPTYARTYTPDQAAEAPEIMRDDLQASDKPLAIVTYMLVRDRPYYARAAKESYFLPPSKGGGAPERRFNRVLILSDESFDRLPAKPATPITGSIVY